MAQSRAPPSRDADPESSARHALRFRTSADTAPRCRGDGVVDEDGGDGGGGGEGVGVEDPSAGRGAIEKQRQLFAELFGVGGAGFACGFGEPRGEGFLVVACVLACGVLRVVDFDGRRDEGAQAGRGHLEGSEESFAGREVGMGLARHGVGNWNLALGGTEYYG